MELQTPTSTDYIWEETQGSGKHGCPGWRRKWLKDGAGGRLLFPVNVLYLLDQALCKPITYPKNST